MNLPHNYKKQIQQKKEKKEILIKQNNQVKQIINSSSNNGNIYAALNNLNNNLHLNQPPSSSDKKDKKVPVKIVKKDEGHINVPKNSVSNNIINISNSNLNQNANQGLQLQGQQINLFSPAPNVDKEKEKIKIKEKNQKINEFEMKLNLGEYKKNIIPEKKRSSTPTPVEKDSISQPKQSLSGNKKIVKEEAETCESVDDYELYKMKKKLINEHMKENPDIRAIEKAHMIVPKSEEMKLTKLLYGDDKSATGFLKNVIGRETVYQEIVNNMDIHTFINQLDQKSSNKNLNVMNDFISNSNRMTVEINLHDKIVVPKEIRKPLSKKIAPTNIIIKRTTLDEVNTVTVPVHLSDKDQDNEFKVCYNEEEGQDYNYQKDTSAIKSTRNNTELINPNQIEDSFDGGVANTNSNFNTNNKNDDSEIENDSEDDDDILAEEKVSVIKDLKINNENNHITPEDNKKQLVKYLKYNLE
jgi:hypothetical protein